MIITRKLSQICNDVKECYTDWRVDATKTRLYKKETELDPLLRIKDAAMEAKAGMLHSRDAAKYEEKAKELISYYQEEITCEASRNHVPVAARLLGLLALILAGVAIWTGLPYLVGAVDPTGVVLLAITFVAPVAIAVIDIWALCWLADRLSDVYLNLRIKKIRRYLATIGRNKQK
ncbi:MAG: hypothetical protein K6F57_01070 [Candidatus Saccharibacteria bacterium]|nr:hypothetical protein [Candidatus Saccharibacteria bacterium]